MTMKAAFRGLRATTALAAVLVLAQSCDQPATKGAPFSVVEATIPDMQAALKAGKVTSHELVAQYLQRIGMYEDTLHAAVIVNPNALTEADALDKERAAGHLRGPLHGIPVAVKDNIQTASDMPTSGGALAFKGYMPPYDATLVQHLKDAGAIIIAKSTLSELANWTAGPPTPMQGGYNAVRGYSYNPYDPRAQENGEPVLATGGSSSGIGVAASLWAANVGTDTGGSVISPSNANMLVGLRPTTGRISRYGIIPIVADQDTAGPMAKTVTDAAIMFGVLEGEPDNHDAATSVCKAPDGHDYTQFLKADALKGARIGIPRAGVYTEMPIPGKTTTRPGLKPDEAQSMTDAIAALTAAGAVIVDPADLPSLVTTDPKENFSRRQFCETPADGLTPEDTCTTVLKYGMKRDFNAWLATLGATAPVKTLTELRDWNTAHAFYGAIRYGQSRLDGADSLDLDKDKARYDADRANGLELSRDKGIDAALKANDLDALLFPGGAAAEFASRAGYPTIAVPFGMVVNYSPGAKGSQDKNRPFGVTFQGGLCSEPKLFGLAYSFEQATKKRVPPKAAP